MWASLKSVPLTFYSRQFYADLILRGKGIGLGLMLVFVLITYGGPMLLGLPRLPAMQDEIRAFFDRFPDITIKDEKLGMDRESPYGIALNPEEKQPVILMFDMNYRANDKATLERDMAEKNIIILVTPDHVVVRKAPGENGIELHSYGSISKKDTVVRHDDWLKIGDSIAKQLPFFFALLLFPLFGFTIIATFFKGLAVKIVATFFRIRPDLKASMRLAVAASLPPAVLGLALYFVKGLGEHPPSAWTNIAGILVWFGLVVFGLACADKDSPPTTTS